MPKLGGYDFALVVTCGLTRFTRVFPCTRHITGEERKFYSDFNTVCLLCLSCCLLFV